MFVDLLLHLFLLLLSFLLKLCDFLLQYIQLLGFLLLDLRFGHLGCVLGLCAELPGLAFVYEGLNHARIASEKDFTACCTGHMTDCDPCDDLAVLDFEDGVWLRLSNLMTLAWRKLVDLNLTVLSDKQATWGLSVLQLCNFDVGDRGFSLLCVAVELPEDNRLISAQFHRTYISILEPIKNYQG